jgi:hypothetical protein
MRPIRDQGNARGGGVSGVSGARPSSPVPKSEGPGAPSVQ